MSQEGPLDDYVNKVIEDTYNPLAEYMMAMPKPVVSAINGPAIGAGVGLGLNADIVLAAKSAYFSLPFVPKLGVIPDMGWRSDACRRCRTQRHDLEVRRRRRANEGSVDLGGKLG